MTNRRLGNSTLSVSAIGLGCWGMSHAYGHADDNESLATIHLCLDRGINFLDTADVYGDGHNERLISTVLKSRRQETVIGTKFGFVGDEHGSVKVNGRPDYVKSACEKSLKRLDIDEIDLYYYHRLDTDVPIEETIGAMADLVAEGKIRYLGLSEVSSETIGRAHRVHPITAVQSEYSFWQRNIEENILQTCKKLEISLIAFSPLGRGFLTGTISSTNGFDKHDYRRQIPRLNSQAIKRNHGIVDMLKEIAQKAGISPAQLSLAWLLAQDQSIVPIPGMKQKKYVDQNLGAVNISLSPDILQKLNQMKISVWGDRHNSHNLKFMDT